MRHLPRIVHDPSDPDQCVDLPVVTMPEWLETVEKLVGRSINKAEKIYAEALWFEFNWTATIVADELRENRAAADLLAACQHASARLAIMYEEAGANLDDNYPPILKMLDAAIAKAKPTGD